MRKQERGWFKKRVSKTAQSWKLLSSPTNCHTILGRCHLCLFLNNSWISHLKREKTGLHPFSFSWHKACRKRSLKRDQRHALHLLAFHTDPTFFYQVNGWKSERTTNRSFPRTSYNNAEDTTSFLLSSAGPYPTNEQAGHAKRTAGFATATLLGEHRATAAAHKRRSPTAHSQRVPPPPSPKRPTSSGVIPAGPPVPPPPVQGLVLGAAVGSAAAAPADAGPQAAADAAESGTAAEPERRRSGGEARGRLLGGRLGGVGVVSPRQLVPKHCGREAAVGGAALASPPPPPPTPLTASSPARRPPAPASPHRRAAPAGPAGGSRRRRGRRRRRGCGGRRRGGRAAARRVGEGRRRAAHNGRSEGRRGPATRLRPTTPADPRPCWGSRRCATARHRPAPPPPRSPAPRRPPSCRRKGGASPRAGSGRPPRACGSVSSEGKGGKGGRRSQGRGEITDTWKTLL